MPEMAFSKMVTDWTQISICWNLGTELSFLLESQSSETLKTLSLSLWYGVGERLSPMSVRKRTGLNLVLVRMSQNLLWMDGLFSRQLLRKYPDFDLAEVSYTLFLLTLNFVLLLVYVAGRNLLGCTLIFWKLFYHVIY